MKNTAMQDLIESFDNYQSESHNDSITIEKLKEVISFTYMELEKQQIVNACNDTEKYLTGKTNNIGDVYYNHNFNQ